MPPLLPERGRTLNGESRRRQRFRPRAPLHSKVVPEFRLDPIFTPAADQPRAIDEAVGSAVRRGPDGHPPGRHRHRQDDDDGGHHRARPAPDARHGAQQDAGRPALQRVPDVLPRQRRRVLRLVLRLLPARGVRPEQGPLHREGLGDQPGGRPPAPRGDRRRLRPPRRHRRRLRVRDLRPRLAGDVRHEHAGAQEGRLPRPRQAPAQARLDPVHAQRHGARPRHVPGARASRWRSSRPTPRPRSARRSSATRSSACSTSTRSPAS